jgi:hypothetical protein
VFGGGGAERQRRRIAVRTRMYPARYTHSGCNLQGALTMTCPLSTSLTIWNVSCISCSAVKLNMVRQMTSSRVYLPRSSARPDVSQQRKTRGSNNTSQTALVRLDVAGLRHCCSGGGG